MSYVKVASGPDIPDARLPGAAAIAPNISSFEAGLSSRAEKMARKMRPPAMVDQHTRICCLTRGETWTAPPDGKSCLNRQHGHLSLGKVEELLAKDSMEMVRGVYVDARGVEIETWIPVARFVNSRRWTRRISLDPATRSGMVVMQFLPG